MSAATHQLSQKELGQMSQDCGDFLHIRSKYWGGTCFDHMARFAPTWQRVGSSLSGCGIEIWRSWFYNFKIMMFFWRKSWVDGRLELVILPTGEIGVQNAEK